MRLIADLNALGGGGFKQTFISLQIIYFVHVLLDCNLFEISISYGFRNIKAINSLCQQPSARLIVTLTAVQISRLLKPHAHFVNRKT